MAKKELCGCLGFEAESDEYPDQCACGHMTEEHEPSDPKYPGDQSCKAER